MRRAMRRTFLALAGAALAAGGCSRDPSPGAQAGSQQLRASFEAARDRCGITVVETEAVKRCMSAQGWAYRLPWQ